ncbi:MAG TPA: AAA family ATPase [Thermoanaerobaculia bacterium]|nr:AAA family ATPase [Thermoanaerobaculia bacterium]
MKPANSFKIVQVELQSIRGFRRLTLDLRTSEGKPRSRTLIIGKNGTRKTTILRAIAIATADLTDASKLISAPIGGLVSEDQNQGTISIKFASEVSDVSASKFITKTGDKESVLFSGGALPPAVFLCGYGAGRFGSGPDISSRSYRIADSVATLFEYQQALIDPELTLHRLRTTFGTYIYDRTLRGLKRALGLTLEDHIELRRGGGVEISGPTLAGRIPLEAWADGYRLTFSWLLDLYAWAMRAESIDEEGHIEGILLLDEIEQHLHPSMQAEILPRLSELLPKMQIFATTHSPLVALDASPEELVVLRREGDEIVAEQNVPNFLGYSVEDMLADPRLFDTEIYGHDTREKLTEYRELAAVPQEERSPDQRSRLYNLATEIRSFEGPAERENETSRLLKQLIRKHGL